MLAFHQAKWQAQTCFTCNIILNKSMKNMEANRNKIALHMITTEAQVYVSLFSRERNNNSSNNF